MKVISLQFRQDGLGPVVFINTVQEGNITVDNELPYVLLDVHKIGAWTSIQTIFDGTPCTYDIQVNLGKIDKTPGSPTYGQMIVDAAVWVNAPTAIIPAALVANYIGSFSAVYLALRINTTTDTSATGTFKVLQQGDK